MTYFVTALCVLLHTSYLGSRLVASLYALELGANPFQVGVLAGLYASLSLLLAITAGKFADRFGPARPMILGSVLGCAALLIAYVFASIEALYVSAMIISAGFIFFNVSVQSMVALLSTPQDRSRNFAILSQGYSVSNLAAPLLGGYAIQYLGAVTSYLVFALLILAPAIGLGCAKSLRALKSPPPTDASRAGVLGLLRDRPLRSSFLSSGLVVTGWDLYTFYLPVHGHAIGLSAVTIGVILAVFGGAAFMVRYFLPPLAARLTEPGLLAWAMLIAAAFFLAFPFFENVYVLCAFSIVLGLTLGLGQPLSMMITYGRAPAGRAGEANGIRLMVNHLTHFAVPIVSGALGTAFGVTPVFWLNAACLTIAARVLRRG